VPDAEAEREPWHCICSEVTCQAGQPKGVKHTLLRMKMDSHAPFFRHSQEMASIDSFRALRRHHDPRCAMGAGYTTMDWFSRSSWWKDVYSRPCFWRALWRLVDALRSRQNIRLPELFMGER